MMRSPGGGSASRSRYTQWCCGQPCSARTGRPSAGPASVTWNRTPRASTKVRRTPAIGGGSDVMNRTIENGRRATVPGMGDYRDLFNASIANPSEFWADAARAVTWTREPQRVLDDSNPPFYRWFPDGELNTCANALDRHVDGGRAEQPALIYDSPVTGSQRTYTYRELLDETARFAGALRGLGVCKGDRVVIYMPMVPEAVFAMLACARLGAIHSVVFGGFAGHSLAARIDDARPKLMITADGGMRGGRAILYRPIYEEALRLSKSPPERVIVFNRGLDKDLKLTP